MTRQSRQRALLQISYRVFTGQNSHLPFFSKENTLIAQRPPALSSLKRILLSTLLLVAHAWGQEASLNDLSTDQLEKKLEGIDTQLSQLANFTMRSGVGAIGHRSKSHQTNTNPEWVEVALDDEEDIDLIVLVPTIGRLTREGLAADGFPRALRVIAGTPGHPDGEIVASLDRSDHLLPRIAPLTIPCRIPQASWIRIEATELSTRAWDERFIFQLSEVLIFRDQKNLALRRPVRVSSGTISSPNARGANYLVDGSLPYLMDAYDGEQSIALVGHTTPDKNLTITIDLEAGRRIEQINLHSTDVEDFIPQAVPSDFGIPRQLLIEGANKPDFSDAVTLLKPDLSSPFKRAPILMLPISGASCRFVRFTIEEAYRSDGPNTESSFVGFGEIEIFSANTNLALGKTAQLNFEPTDPSRLVSSLTDGRNYHGNILSIREWIKQLSLRHDLENERPRVVGLLKTRYDEQETNLNLLLWILPLLLTGTIIIVLVNRSNQQRAIHRARELIAADLHDELGANLHAIGLLGDLARASDANPGKRESLLLRMRTLTQKTGAAARYCTNMLEAKENYEDVDVAMKRSSSRLLADLEHEITFEGEDHLKKLSPRRRIDICLFYKECLTNILRHSGAGKVTTHLKADKKEIILEVTDNGFGMDGVSDEEIPPSLKRRARIIGAQIQTKHLKPQGLKVILMLNYRRWRFLT